MNADSEFDQLLAGLLDGSADAAAHRRLCETLREHPERVDEYLDQMQMHALLQWRGGSVVPRSSPPDISTTASPRRRRMLRQGMLACVVCVVAGVGLFLVLMSQPARATPDTVERLIDWNIELTQARTPSERARIHGEQSGRWQAALAQPALPATERELARTLLSNGDWLAEHSDPVVESSRFSDIADLMLTQMESATVKNDSQQVARLTESYCRIAKLGIDANIERELQSNGSDDERKQRIGGCLKRNADRAKKLTSLAERSSDSCRKHFRRASNSSSKFGDRNSDAVRSEREARRLGLRPETIFEGGRDGVPDLRNERWIKP